MQYNAHQFVRAESAVALLVGADHASVVHADVFVDAGEQEHVVVGRVAGDRVGRHLPIVVHARGEPVKQPGIRGAHLAHIHCYIICQDHGTIPN